MSPNFSLGKITSPENGLVKKIPSIILRSPIPPRFSNYRLRGDLIKGIAILNEKPYHVRKYSLDNDGFSEVIEFYPFIKNPKSISKGTILKRGIHISLNPEMYFFDKNNNNEVDNGELLIDPEKDGLNYNEYWFHQNNKSKK
tara:strand:+ start:8505 stop:8930 length:426 start_codon:yes stop_codon:yes gene_type:complete